jgi:hypothetical protein
LQGTGLLVHANRLAGGLTLLNRRRLELLGDTCHPAARVVLRRSAFDRDERPWVLPGGVEGPIVGELIFWALNKFFSDHGTRYLLGLGLLAIVVTLFFKQGLWGWMQQRWGWSLFPTQRWLEP